MRKTSVEQKCERCGTVFKVPPCRNKKAKVKYCSMKCYLAERWKQNGNCNQCGKKTKTRFCSPECQKKYWNEHGYKVHKRKRIWERKLALIKELGGKCTQCGIDDPRCLDIHHINGDSKIRPPKNQWAWSYRFKDWEANKGNLELLCANCHRIHTWESRDFGPKTS